MKELDDLLSVWELHLEKGESISAEELCRENPELLEKVRWHIQALQEVESRFGVEKSEIQNSIPDGLGRNGQLLNQELVITTRYHIDHHHASGGLGDVFIGTDPVIKRKVAIKFPRQTRLTKEHLSRFEREARITGQLDHPGIVAVHSLKLEDESQPCYVMRFVDGKTLEDRVKEFHQQTARSLEKGRFTSVAFRELLQHFVSLCNIVGYAHAQRVIHRDIKPSNVIIGQFGETFLMDWGLARELDGPRSNSLDARSETDLNEPLDDNSAMGCHHSDTVTKQMDTDREAVAPGELAGGAERLYTRRGQFLGTPAFAAPEQLLGQIEQIDSRSDLYALGATLFFLIAGQPPIRETGSEDHINSLRTGKLSWVAFPEGTPAALQAICRQAISFAPGDRYSSARGLSADVQQYLADEPVSVLTEPWSNRTFRWLRKNRTLTTTIATSLMLLTVLSVMAAIRVSRLNSRLTNSNLELNRINSELLASRSRESQARQLAEGNFDAAREAVQQYLIRIDDHEKLDQSDFSELKRELLTSAKPFLERLRSQKSDNSAVNIARIEAAYRLAVIASETGEQAEAIAEYEQCVAMIKEALQDDPDNSDLLHRLGVTYCGLAADLQRQSKLNEAESYCRSAVELAEAALQKNPDEVRMLDIENRSRVSLGNILSLSGKQQAAAEVLEQAIVSGNAHLMLEPESEQAIENLSRAYEVSGFILRVLGKKAESLKHRQLALGFREQLVEKFPKHSRYRTYLGMGHLNLGVILAETGQPDSAREHYLKGLTIHRQLAVDYPSNPLHLEHAAKTLNNLGNIASPNGPGPTPVEYLQQAIELHEQLCERFGDDVSQLIGLGGAHCNLGNFQMRSDPELAIVSFDKAEEFLKRSESQSADVPQTRNYLRNVYGGRASAWGMLYHPLEAKRDWLSAAEYDEGPNRAFFEAQALEAAAKADKTETFEAALETGLQSVDPTEWAAFGEFCLARKRIGLAVTSFRQAFIEQTELIDQFGDNGALAALARAEELLDASQPDTDREQRRELRGLALSWLNRQLDSLPNTPARRQKLRQWKWQPSLQALMTPDINSDLDAHEVTTWREFWEEVEEKLK